MITDFTKEELVLVKVGIEYLHENMNESRQRLEQYEYLIGKIQSMIDNYCEHEWENPCCGCPDSACLCIKCGKNL